MQRAVMPVLDPFWFPKVWGKPKRILARCLAHIRGHYRQIHKEQETNKKIAALELRKQTLLGKNKKIAGDLDGDSTSQSSPESASNYQRYRTDPVAYARDILEVHWWAKQQEIAQALLKPPHRVLVKACHSVGKTHVAAGLVNWWYDTHDPGVVLTTAPTARQVQDVLWKEVRSNAVRAAALQDPRFPVCRVRPTISPTASRPTT